MITSFFSPKPKPTGSGPAVTDGNTSGSKRGRTVTPNDDGAKNEDTSSSPSPSSRSNKRTKASPTTTSALFRPPSSYGGDNSGRPMSPEVEELLSHLCVGGAPSEDGVTTWRHALQRHVSTPGFGSLAKFVASERAKGKTVYPPPADTFSALNLTPLHKVKVVIVGQDPYHGPNQGHGLAFSVRRGIAIPPSLKNIYKELANDGAVPFPSANDGGAGGPARMPTHGNLENWARQGVLLLNAVLTVRGGDANSHQKKGWEAFTDECIRVIDRECRVRRSSSSSSSSDTKKKSKGGIVFLLWGRPASKKAEGVISKSGGHAVICTSHPSPLGATKTNNPFLGSRCFSRANDALRERGLEPIDWNVD